MCGAIDGCRHRVLRRRCRRARCPLRPKRAGPCRRAGSARAAGGTAAKSFAISARSTIEASSTITTSTASGRCAIVAKVRRIGQTSEQPVQRRRFTRRGLPQRLHVRHRARALCSMDSCIRAAALPGRRGEGDARRLPARRTARAAARGPATTVRVLPVPGPPVMTQKLFRTAVSAAARCPSVFLRVLERAASVPLRAAAASHSAHPPAAHGSRRRGPLRIASSAGGRAALRRRE